MTWLASATSSCRHKRRYADQGQAAVNAVYRTKKGAPPLRPYHCPACKGWHLTKKMETRR